MSHPAEQIAESNRLLHNIASVGVVSAVDASLGKMRLRIGDNETDWVQIPSIACGSLKVWRCPSVGEQFAVLSESGNLGNAIALVALPSDVNPLPSDDPNKIVFQFETGSFVIDMAKGDATVQLNKLTFDVPNVDFTGKVNVQDIISSLIDVIADNISLKNHLTTGVRSGSDVSGVPQ